MTKNKSITGNNRSAYIHLQRPIFILALAGLGLSIIMGNIVTALAIIAFPLAMILFHYILEYPSTLTYLLLAVNYFILGITRYIPIEGVSMLIDIILFSQLFLIYLHCCLKQNIEWKNVFNLLTLFGLLWAIYCILEVGNPTAMFKTWILSRGLTYYGLIVPILIVLTITEYRQVRVIIFVLSIFILLASIKAFIQKFVGFDNVEWTWLMSGAYRTHIIYSGIRYFSFFTDAGNFGSNMGFGAIVYALLTFSEKQKGLKIYYAIISILAFYAMLLSGTRGAIAVPLAGLTLFTLICKNYKAIIMGGATLLLLYIFFAFTTIGQSNDLIRRMRTAFEPTKDASYNVRKENQQRLAAYLKHKPFGEGLGLSGGENKIHSNRFTTSIPNDSWYVKLWVETGIVGAILYVGGLFIVIGRCSWLLMFKVKNKQIRKTLTPLVCGVFGLLVSAYGNPFWGQFPTAILAFTCLAIAINAPNYDRLYCTTNYNNELK